MSIYDSRALIEQELTSQCHPLTGELLGDMISSRVMQRSLPSIPPKGGCEGKTLFNKKSNCLRSKIFWV